ncbi:cyclase family protein [Sphingomonas lenta]|uniref:cyclase family protein n=1 Tax=Sphingomonas lenta TaxID=1141887 RepID=UPI001FE7458F|nr:cyclase family protein [Sphingomonas lenta]
MRRVELNQIVTPGVTTYKGLPGPVVCDYWTREQSAARYDDGETFQIERVEMVGNTGTYLDTPYHRFAHGHDLAGLPLERVAGVLVMIVRRPFAEGLAVDADAFAGRPIRGRAVLVHTGWDAHWGTPAYFDDHPFLTESAARLLADEGAAVVGIDSHNIDDTRAMRRPVHTALLGGGVPIVEHLTNLDAVADGARFYAVPPRFQGVGTFPVRAFAELP